MRSAHRADQELGGHLEGFWAGEGGGAEGAVGGRGPVVEGSGVESDGWDEVEVWGDEIEETEEVGLSTFSTFVVSHQSLGTIRQVCGTLCLVGTDKPET